MFVLKDFVPNCFVAQICANYGAHAHFGAYLRDEAIPNKILSYEHWNYPKEHAYQFLAQTVKSEARYRVEKPENRVHKLTDSNGALWRISELRDEAIPNEIL